jgi:DNA-directed RNA polymerase subunit H (RpoH/RPB5)
MSMDIEKAKKYMVEMFIDRGYSQYDIEVNDDNIIGQSEELGSIIGVFVSENKLSVNTLRDIISACESADMKRLVLVYNESITASANNTLKSITSVFVELFCITELMYNPTTHRLSSKHERVSEEEAKAIKTKYGKDLPILLRSDKMARWYNFKSGEIIKVTRPSEHVIYRIVR